MQLLQVNGIGKKQAGNWIVRNISFNQQRFQKIVVAGETGSGKSTLLKMIAGLEHPDAGIAYFEDKKVISPLDTLVPGHPGIAYLSQYFELRNNYRVEELLEYANRLSEKEASLIFDVCRITHLVKRKVDQVSGGEKQRIALARLLVGAPKLLLLDEPFSNMDPIHKELLKNVLEDISNKLQITCILTSHDPVDTLAWADEIMVMKAGQMIQQDAPENIYQRPVNEYVAGLFGRYNLLNAMEAAAFLPLKDLPDEPQRVFIRPEAFINDEKGMVTGIVQQSIYRGSHYELEVLVDGKILVMRSDRKTKTLNISLSKIYETHYI